MKKRYTVNDLKADIEDYNTRLQDMGLTYSFDWGSTYNQNDLWLIHVSGGETNRSRIESGSPRECKKAMTDKFLTLTKQ